MLLFFTSSVNAVEENWLGKDGCYDIEERWQSSKETLMSLCEADIQAANWKELGWETAYIRDTDVYDYGITYSWHKPAYWVDDPTAGGAWERSYDFLEYVCYSPGFAFSNETHACVVADCGPDEVWDADLAQCVLIEDPPEEPAEACEDEAGQPATDDGYFGGYDSAQDFLNLSCSAGCIAIFNGGGPYTFPNSDDPNALYFLGRFNYASVPETCSASDIPSPQQDPPLDQNSPPEDQEGNGNCPNGWFLYPDGSCGLSEDPDDLTSELNCPEGQYYVSDLGLCLSFGDVSPDHPSGGSADSGEPTDGSSDESGEPTGGGHGDDPQIGGNDGTGQSVGASAVDTDGDGETNDEGFCTQYPESPICKESSYVDKGCEVEPECAGDAIQCYHAKALWGINCAMNEKLEDVESGAFDYEPVIEELATVKTDFKIKIDEITASAKAAMGFDLQGGGTLSADALELRWGAFDINHASVFTKFNLLGALIMFFAAVASALIVLGER